MRISLYAVVATLALLSHFVGGWVTSSSQAKVEIPAPAYSIDPSQ